MSDPAIGALRQRLALEAPDRTEGEGGTAEIGWTTVADVWARIVPGAGRELVRSDGTTARLTHEIVLRYRGGVLPEMRFRQGSRVFQIHALIDISERRRWLRCLCEEHLP